MTEKMQKGKDDAWLLIYGPPVQRSTPEPPTPIPEPINFIPDIKPVDEDNPSTKNWVHFLLDYDQNMTYFEEDDLQTLMRMGSVLTSDYYSQIICDRQDNAIYYEQADDEAFKYRLHAAALLDGVISEGYTH